MTGHRSLITCLGSSYIFGKDIFKYGEINFGYSCEGSRNRSGNVRYGLFFSYLSHSKTVKGRMILN